MNEVNQTHRIGALARLAITVLVPSEMRAAFEAELLEELALRSREGRGTRRWVWGQVLRSAPALLRRQLQGSGARPVTVSMSVLIVTVSAVFFWLNGFFALPVLPASAIGAGLLLTTLGLFFTTPGMRLLTLAGGVSLALVGLALAGDGLGEGFFLIFTLPGFAHTSLVPNAGHRGCRRRRSSQHTPAGG